MYPHTNKVPVDLVNCWHTESVFTLTYTHIAHFHSGRLRENKTISEVCIYLFIFAKSQHVYMATRERDKGKPKKPIKIHSHLLKLVFPMLFVT